jgi:AcrR family transcriptional regulator
MGEMTETSYNPTALKILDTAARLFMQLGYSAVSITDIVTGAEVTKPTLYYYFPDKAELFTQMALQQLIKLHGALDAALARSDDTATRLGAFATVLLNADDGDMRMLRHEMAEHLPAEHQGRLGVAFHQHLFMPIHDVMQAGAERGELASHSAAELTMLFLGLMEAFHGYPAQIDRMRIPPELGALRPAVFAPAALVETFLHGVAPQAGQGETQ